MSAARSTTRSAGDRVQAVAIVGAMVVGSVTLWIANPAFWLWVTARLQTTQARMGPYALMLLGVLVTAIACGKCLAILNRRYAKVMGDNTVRLHLPWARGLGGEHERELRTVTVLDVVMVVSVLVAAAALLAWFLIVQPAPPGVGPGPSKD
jgi:hypothetical protein